MLEKASFSCAGGCTPGNSRLWSWSPVGTVQDRPRRQPKRRLNAALAGEASARPCKWVTLRAINALGPGPRWGPFRTDRGGSRDGGLTPRLCKALAHVRAMGGCTPGNSRLWSWSPVGSVQDRPRRRLKAALVGEASARPRHGFLGTPAAWNFAFPSLKLHKTGVNCRKSMVPGWKTLAKQAILRYYGKVNGAGGLPRRPPG